MEKQQEREEELAGEEEEPRWAGYPIIYLRVGEAAGRLWWRQQSGAKGLREKKMAMPRPRGMAGTTPSQQWEEVSGRAGQQGGAW